jgi:hypothetical protein
LRYDDDNMPQMPEAPEAPKLTMEEIKRKVEQQKDEQRKQWRKVALEVGFTESQADVIAELAVRVWCAQITGLL